MTVPGRAWANASPEWKTQMLDWREELDPQDQLGLLRSARVKETNCSACEATTWILRSSTQDYTTCHACGADL